MSKILRIKTNLRSLLYFLFNLVMFSWSSFQLMKNFDFINWFFTFSDSILEKSPEQTMVFVHHLLAVLNLIIRAFFQTMLEVEEFLYPRFEAVLNTFFSETCSICEQVLNVRGVDDLVSVERMIDGFAFPLSTVGVIILSWSLMTSIFDRLFGDHKNGTAIFFYYSFAVWVYIDVLLLGLDKALVLIFWSSFAGLLLQKARKLRERYYKK